jgi:hypothetical protein
MGQRSKQLGSRAIAAVAIVSAAASPAALAAVGNAPAPERSAHPAALVRVHDGPRACIVPAGQGRFGGPICGAAVGAPRPR